MGKFIKKLKGLTMWEIRDYLRKNVRLYDWLETKYYNITIGIHNIFQWLPIVWKDREWEFEHFTMQFVYKKLKLHQVRDYDAIIVDGWWMTRYINLCILLIDEDRKIENLEDDLWKSIENPDHSFGEPDEKGLVQLFSNWSSPEAKERYWEVERQRMIRQKKIKHLIFKILETRSGYWWD